MIEIRDLTLEYVRADLPPVRALDHITLTIPDNEILGVVGESGCGKTSLAFSLLRAMPANARVVTGQILFEGRDLLGLSERRMRNVRWAKLAMVFQSSMNAFSPVHRVIDQLAAVHRVHLGSEKRDARRAAEKALLGVGIPPDRVRCYPHEFSGGMRQRAAIALALLLDPQVLIADEPTTALDVIVQDQILKMIETWQREKGRTVIFVSHDVAVVSEMCHRIAVMYAGELVELGDKQRVIDHPEHPYTDALLKCLPKGRRDERLLTLPGSPPDLSRPHEGCAFQPRCPVAFDECSHIRPDLYMLGNGQLSRCLLRRTVAR
ncbi:MAG: ABC transporter ATP-binding protein [Thermoplasmata archaeon]